MFRIVLILVLVLGKLHAQEKSDRMESKVESVFLSTTEPDSLSVSRFTWLLYKASKDSSLLQFGRKAFIVRSNKLHQSGKERSGQVKSLQAAVQPLADSSRTELLSGGCVEKLTEPKFLQLRARMAAASDESEMILMVVPIIQDYCFSVSQLRRLCSIFLYEKMRYAFLEKVYLHVVDPASLPDLAIFLTDPGYQKRFLSLLER